MKLFQIFERRREKERQRIINLRSRSFALEVQDGGLYITCDGIACYRFGDDEAKGVVDTFLKVRKTSIDFDNVKPPKLSNY